MSARTSMEQKFVQLREAIKAKNNSLARQLILNNAPVNMPSSSGHPLLHWVITKHHSSEILELLIDKKIDLRFKNRHNDMPIEIAIDLRKNQFAELLLQKGKYSIAELQSFMSRAIKKYNPSIVEKIFDYTIRRDPKINLINCLKEAIDGGYTEIVELMIPYTRFTEKSDRNLPKSIVSRRLLPAGSDTLIHVVDRLIQHGYIVTPGSEKDYKFFYSAVERGFTGIVKQCLEYKMDINMINKRNKDTELNSLHFACHKKYDEIAKMLIEYGADVNLLSSNSFSGTTCSQNEKYQVGNSCLHFAVFNNDEDLTNFLLNHGANLDNDPNFFQIVHIAIANGYQKIASTLLKTAKRINAVNDQKQTFLHSCSAINENGRGNEELRCQIAESLIKRGIDINAQTKSRITPIFKAVKNGYVELTKLLLTYNANVYCTDIDRNNLLHAAAEFDSSDFVDMLMNYNIDVNAVNKNGETPLHIACQRESFEDEYSLIEKLFRLGAQINSVDIQGRTPLHWACFNNHFEAVEMLLVQGAAVNHQDIHGKSPLHYGCEALNALIIEVLLTNQADPNLTDDSGYSAIHIVASAKAVATAPIEDIIKMLVEYKADINSLDTNDQTALFLACKAHNPDNDNINTIKALLENEVDINKVDKTGKTVLQSALYDYNCNSDVLKLLLKCKPNVHFINAYRQTLLHICAYKGYPDVVGNLVRLRVNIDQQDDEGNTALHIATQKGHRKMVENLLYHGANIDVLNNDYQTAFKLAYDEIDRLNRELDDREYDDYGEDDRNDNPLDSYLLILTSLSRHVIKLKCAGFEVRSQDEHIVYDAKRRYCPYDASLNVDDFESACRNEIENLKNEAIGIKRLTLFDLLVKDVGSIGNCARNKKLMEALKSDEYRKKFSLYIHLIRSRLFFAKVRNYVIEVAHKRSVFSDLKKLSPACVDEIFGYLSMSELNSFVSAFDP